MSERANILARIREGLAMPAPVPGAHDLHGHEHAPNPAPILPGMVTKWLPSGAGTFGEQIALFTKNSFELKTDFQLFDSQSELRGALATLAQIEGWERIGTHGGALTDEICPTLGLPILRTDNTYSAQELETCNVGISECDFLIAQTGSVLVTTRSAGGRALSVLPPHHVVLARREQLLPDLSAGFAALKKKYADNFPSFMSLITGPSRTGDIERILVLGAHGPKKLTIFCY
ncbi:MAG TPA: LUD domain-containing protein [Chthoniobacterales bacterium]|jgi:L-lactate dehydrogenase complex protein LldG